ncbi:MAG: helix-turn-helix domain-containing protein [Stellaceae bacterium]
MRALGEEFRAAREARGLSLSDVSEQIHIRSVYLQALENEDWSAIGAPVYTRGFIRTYARFLGLDPESAVQRFSETGSGAAPVAPPQAPGQAREPSGDTGERRRTPSPMLYAAAALALVLVGAVLYNFYSLQVAGRNKVPVGAAPVASASAGPAVPPTAAAAIVAPSAPAAPNTPLAPSAAVAADARALPSAAPSPEMTAAAVKMTKTLTLKLSETSWLRVLVDGQSVMEGEFPQGTVRTFHGNKALVRIGNAGGVDVEVNGQSVGKLGNSGDVVERDFSLAGE